MRFDVFYKGVDTIGVCARIVLELLNLFHDK